MTDPFKTKFTDSDTFDWLMVGLGMLAAILLVAGVVWALGQTNDPAYEPPSSYQTGEPR